MVSRYLARDLGPSGIRVNLVSAGPLGTVAAQGIPGFEQLAELWRAQAPLAGHRRSGSGRQGDLLAAHGLRRCDHRRDVHVDGGFHAVGAAVPGSRRRAA